MFRIALKSTLARRRRLVTTALAVVLSVAFISGTMVLSNVLSSAVDDLISDSYRGIDVVLRSDRSQETQFGGTSYREPVDGSLLTSSARVPGVRAATGVVLGYPTLVGNDGKRVSTGGLSTTTGTNWIDDDRLRGRTVVDGRAPTAAGELTIDAKTAETEKFAVGDSLLLQAPGGAGTFTIVGLTGLGSSADRTTGATEVRFAAAEAQRLFKKDGRWDYVALAASPGVTESTLRDTLLRAVPRGTQVLTGAQFIEENQKEFSRVISLITDFVLAFGWISVFVGVFVITNTFSIIVAQRIRELALLRAVGASRRQILSSVLIEATAVGLTAAILGIVAGLGLAIALTKVLGSFISLPPGIPTLTPAAILVGLAVGLGATVTSALFPALRATRVPPVAAMTDVALDRTSVSVRRAVLGLVLALTGAAAIAVVLTDAWDLGTVGVGVGAALLFTSVAVGGPVLVVPVARFLGSPIEAMRGVTGRIAHQNAARNPRRTAVAAAALTIGVGLVTVIATFASSLEGSFSTVFATQLAKVDAVIDAGTGDGGVPIGVRPELAKLEQVRRVTSIRWTPLTILNSAAARDNQRKAAATPGPNRSATSPVGEPRWILGVDAATLLPMVSLEGLAPKVTDLADDEVMVMRSTALKNGWRVGDTIKVNFPRTGAVDLKVAALFDTRLSGGEYFINLRTFEANALPELLVDSQVWVQLRPGVTVAEAKPAIRSVLKRLAPAAGVNDVQSFINERTALFTPLLNVIYGLLALAIVIALFGVANTISLSIFERTRELGLLRAVGMGRAQVRSSVRWESAIIALLGTLLGVGIGVGLAVSFVIGLGENGISPIVPGLELVVIALLGALVGILTAVRPARRAAGVDILGALAAT